MNEKRTENRAAEEPFESDKALGSLVRELAAEARARREEHLDPDTLIGYIQGELGSADADKVRAHIATCPDCAGAVLDLTELTRFEAAPGDPSPEEVAVRLRGLELRLSDRPDSPTDSLATPSGTTTGEPIRTVVPFKESSPRWLLPLAWAASLVLVASLVYLLNVGSAGPEANAGPQANIHVVSLTPNRQAVVRDPEAGNRLRVPAAAESFVVILNLTSPATFPSYQLSVRLDAEVDSELWRSNQLRPLEAGVFTFEIERDFLPPNRYRFELSGIEGDEETPLAVYTVELTYD